MIDRRRASIAAAIATAIAVPAEGIRQFAYYDPPGILTVCIGHTGKDIDPKKKYSLDECRQFLTVDMLKAVETVDRCAPNLPEHVLAAFGDAVFNLGPSIACDKSQSTAARMLAAGDLEGACNQLPRWNKAQVAGVKVPLPGLTTRRGKERLVCLGEST